MDTANPYALYLKRLAPSSQRSIQSQLKQIVILLEWPVVDAEARFHQITYEQGSQIQALLKEKGWSARSINRAMSAIIGIIKEGALMGLVQESHSIKLSSIKRVRQAKYKGNTLDKHQVTQLFKQLNLNYSALSVRNTAIFALLLGAGLRRSELVATTLSELDIDKQTLFIPKGKGSKSRDAFLPQWCCEHLRDWLKHRTEVEGLLFNPVLRSGRIQSHASISASTVYTLVRNTLSNMGIDGVSPHDLRRTYITRLLEQGVDINTVRQLAGHEDISTTVIYDKRDDKTMRQAAERLRYVP